MFYYLCFLSTIQTSFLFKHVRHTFLKKSIFNYLYKKFRKEKNDSIFIWWCILFDNLIIFIFNFGKLVSNFIHVSKRKFEFIMSHWWGIIKRLSLFSSDKENFIVKILLFMISFRNHVVFTQSKSHNSILIVAITIHTSKNYYSNY